MKKTARIISTYTGDTSGVCSALFELGGMTVMHDASGCNSTYSTHDEPRWYDHDSLVFISGLTEMEAIMGDDEKLIGDVVSAARELSPRFIAVAGTPIPMMTGVDFAAVARRVEEETGIPAFGFATNGMHDYVSGVSMALAAVAGRFCRRDVKKSDRLCVNLLGVTPLDFSVNGSDTAMTAALRGAGIGVCSVFAMGSTLAEIENAGAAQVNLVVSAGGLAAAETLKSVFGTPYVIGAPFGEKLTGTLITAIKDAAQSGQNITACAAAKPDGDTVIIGEGVTALSLAAALRLETGISPAVLCAAGALPAVLAAGGIVATDEDELIPHLADARRIIADPLYRPVCPGSAAFVPLPHEAFSGRIYRRKIPNLVSDFNQFVKEVIV